ncbi:MAG: hypothetical protein KC561_04735 [Myxococcales bacterium]|nr:hypothetical protein [Myxococcales bacterium]
MESDKLHARLRTSDAYSFLRLEGIIDEDNRLGAMTSKLTGSALIVDTADVRRINSCGVRDWVNWLTSVEQSGQKSVLIRCSPAIVSQINLVTNFAGDAVVHSFFAPYYCPSCDSEVLKLIETETLLGVSPVRAPSFRCEECGTGLEFDDIEDSYFAFINATDPDAIDHRLKRLVDEVSPNIDAKIRALNEAGSAPLSGPLHTFGGLTGEQQSISSEPNPPPVPLDYLDVREVEEAAQLPPSSEPADPTPAPSAASEPSTKYTSGLMIGLVIAAAVVISLLVYLALTGI